MTQWMNLQRIYRFVGPTGLYISCGKSGGLHLVESDLMAGRQADWLAGRQNLGKVYKFKINFAVYRVFKVKN